MARRRTLLKGPSRPKTTASTPPPADVPAEEEAPAAASTDDAPSEEAGDLPVEEAHEEVHEEVQEDASSTVEPLGASTVPAELALKYKAVLIPVYGIRQDNGLDFEVELSAEIPHSDPVTMTKSICADLEAVIRKHMGQWFWIHRRWKPYVAPAKPQVSAQQPPPQKDAS